MQPSARFVTSMLVLTPQYRAIFSNRIIMKDMVQQAYTIALFNTSNAAYNCSQSYGFIVSPASGDSCLDWKSGSTGFSRGQVSALGTKYNMLCIKSVCPHAPEKRERWHTPSAIVL